MRRKSLASEFGKRVKFAGMFAMVRPDASQFSGFQKISDLAQTAFILALAAYDLIRLPKLLEVPP